MKVKKYRISQTDRISQIREVLDQYSICYSDKGIQDNYDCYSRNKRDLINVLRNFRCRHFYLGGQVVFFGRDSNAKIAKEVFEYAYNFAYKESNRLTVTNGGNSMAYNRGLADGRTVMNGRRLQSAG